jgi:hypothetical protein
LGDADQSGDGRVSLAEAYAYAYERTVADTADTAAGPQHPTFSFDLAGNGDLVLTDVVERREGVLIAAHAPAGQWFLVDPRGFVVAEIAKAEGVERLVALAPGRYWVRRRLADHLRVGQITVATGEIAQVDDRALKNADFSADPVKGAYQTLVYSRHWGVGITGGYQIVFEKAPEVGGYFPSAPMFGLDLTLHNAFGRGWGAAIDGQFGWAQGQQLLGNSDLVPLRYSDFVIGATVMHEWPDNWWVPSVGLRVALNLMNRDFPGTGLPSQSFQTFVPGLVLGMKVRVTKSWSVLARTRLNLLLYTVDHTRGVASLELAGLLNYEFGQ